VPSSAPTGTAIQSALNDLSLELASAENTDFIFLLQTGEHILDSSQFKVFAPELSNTTLGWIGSLSANGTFLNGGDSKQPKVFFKGFCLVDLSNIIISSNFQLNFTSASNLTLNYVKSLGISGYSSYRSLAETSSLLYQAFDLYIVIQKVCHFSRHFIVH
jgi:hypothetical protein